MEHPHNLLLLVLKHHYNHRPDILESANNIIKGYCASANPNYEKTLGTLYQIMNDLPPDILLYFLTTVPMPKIQDTKTQSVLSGLMRQMLCAPYHNSMRPILLKYLNDQVPPLVPISAPNPQKSASKPAGNEILNCTDAQISVIPQEENYEAPQNVRSVIDENIKLDKNKCCRKGFKVKNKNNTIKNAQIKPLAMLCANHIYKQHKFYSSKYNKQKKDAWKLVNNNMCNKKELARCYEVIRDVNKKIRWLSMFKSGVVPLDVIEDEYGKSDVFYMERQLQDTVSDDVLNLSSDLIQSVNIFLSKC